MRKNFLVKIKDEYVESQKIGSDIGMVLRGPYERVIKITENFSTCEPMYDLLVDGKIHKLVPCVYCTRIKRQV
tara:strand:- start:536 stop:754 length:219 start_codon:yes stop_codon:yes gene_type:complete